MPVNKAALYTFVEKKRLEVIATKLAPLRKEKADLIKQARLDLIVKVEAEKGVTIEEVAKDMIALRDKCAILTDELRLHWGDVRHFRGRLERDTVQSIVDSTISNIEVDVQYPPRVNDLEVEIQAVENRIRDQFTKLEAIIKGNSAKIGLGLLKEAGFNMEEVELQFATPKNEIKALDIDNDLLGLPEAKKASEGASENG